MKIYFTPKKSKHKKYFRGRLSNVNQSQLMIKNGDLGLQALQQGRISVEQLESFRRTFRRQIKKKGTVSLNKKANLLLTAKPGEVRMGSGKGNPSIWVVKILTNSILFEFKGLPILKTYFMLKKAYAKLSLKTKIIYK